MMRAGVFAAAIALSALAAAAQNAPTSGPFTISGVVLSATTGAPLDRAQVTISTAGEEETQVAEVVTGEGGAFRFDHLPAGKYALAASRRGTIASRYQEHEDGYSTAIVTGTGLVSEGLRFQLFPTAVIGGTITDDGGDPVAGARVILYRQQQQEGQTKVVSADSETTADDGTYEFARVHAGTYYVGVSANPWYAFHPPRRAGPDGAALPSDQQPTSPLDVAYPMTFYANATDSNSATPIQISPGDHSELNLTMHAVAAVHLEIRAAKPDMSHGFAVPQLSEEVFGSDEYRPQTQVTMQDAGDQMVIDLGAVAPGHYLLHDFIVNGVNRHASVDLAGDQSIDFSAPGNAVDLSGKVEMASGAALPAATMLQLTPSGGGSTSTAPVKTDGSFALPALSPGEYNVTVVSSTGLLSVVQMAASGAEVHGHRITVGTDSVLLAATLASGSVAVSGFARRDGKGLGGALVLLVPEHPQDNGDLFRRDQSDSDGSFTLRRVAPGNYTLVAIENGWSMEWSRPEVIAPYLAHGMKLRITGQPANLTLPSPVAVQ